MHTLRPLAAIQIVFSGLLMGCLELHLSASDQTPSHLPPAGFTALWNGHDLAGWWGATTEDPRKYMSLPQQDFQKKHDASLKDICQHWTAQEGELVNDGKGLFLTTEKYYGDFELLVDYRTVPKADSGIYLRGWSRQRSGFPTPGTIKTGANCLTRRPKTLIPSMFPPQTTCTRPSA